MKPMTTRFTSLSLNCLRVIGGWIFLIVILSLSGKVAEMGLVPGHSVAYIIGSGVIGVSVGTTLFIQSMRLTEITRIYPASYGSWVLGTVAVAAIFLNETITNYTILGGVVTVMGIVLLNTSFKGQSKANPVSASNTFKGMAIAIIAGICWAAGSVLIKIGLSGANPLVVNVVRLPAVLLALIALVAWREGPNTFSKYDWKSLLRVGCAGILDQGLGATLWFVSIELAGVAKATILSNASPLFVAPFAFFFLKEKVTPKVILGTVLCVLGIWLTVL